MPGTSEEAAFRTLVHVTHVKETIAGILRLWQSVAVTGRLLREYLSTPPNLGVTCDTLKS